MKKEKEFFRGCLLGGAIGDALGWPVEFMDMAAIRGIFGVAGITDLVLRAGNKAEITDDTQMTLFTAEGLLRAESRARAKGICHPPTMAYLAYLRWYYTQGYPKSKETVWIYDGWLLTIKELFVQRAPGSSCLSALAGGHMGTLQEPVNNSKGCGGVMRMAPVGLYIGRDGAFKLGAEFAALTHGHPSGYLSAGALAHMIACIVDGEEIMAALEDTLVVLDGHPGSSQCTNALRRAISLAVSGEEPGEAIRELGGGWVGEEALAIAVYCVLRFNHDFKKTLIAAVNHDGDSDSTGAIAGNILGAYLGVTGLPQPWVDKVELAGVIAEIADDLHTRHEETREWMNKYPGW
jgi:ADP-ribosylglycohydrolase